MISIVISTHIYYASLFAPEYSLDQLSHLSYKGLILKCSLVVHTAVPQVL